MPEVYIDRPERPINVLSLASLSLASLSLALLFFLLLLCLFLFLFSVEYTYDRIVLSSVLFALASSMR